MMEDKETKERTSQPGREEPGPTGGILWGDCQAADLISWCDTTRDLWQYDLTLNSLSATYHYQPGSGA